MANKHTITVCTGIGMNMFFPEYVTIEIETDYEKSKTPTSAKEMWLADPVPNIDNVKPITKMSSKQLKDLGLKK